MDDGRIEIIEDEVEVNDTINSEGKSSKLTTTQVDNSETKDIESSPGSTGLEFESDDPWMKRHKK